MDSLFAVFDANNFYVSCERVFSPKLRNRAAVVASQSGGIILARSNEAKALGIPMAGPVFQWSEFLKLHDVLVAPANFPLYADISSRIEQILHESFPFVEDYSIDESFVLFPHGITKPEEIYKHCKAVREKILKWIGVPVSVGIAKTKTLAKIGVKYAKKTEEGVTMLITEEEERQAIATFPLEDVWGVGWALQRKLPAYGISTTRQLADADPITVRKHFSVVLAKTIQELKGIPCFLAGETVAPMKSMMSTGSFTEEITDRHELQTRLAEFALLVAERLRKHKLIAGGMVVFTRGNRFHKEKGYVALQKVIQFAPYTSRSSLFSHAIEDAMNEVFFEGARIKRAGVYAYDVVPKDVRQLSLFEIDSETKVDDRDDKVYAAIDAVNHKWGDRVIKPALLLTKKGKTPRLTAPTNRVSLRYWSQILKIKI